MRYKENRKHLVSEDGVPLTVKGLPDMRYKQNRKNLVSEDGIPLTVKGLPDMRYKICKELYGKKQTVFN